MPCAIVLRADYQTSALLGAPEHSLKDVDELLLIVQHPVQFVVVSGTEIAHYVLVAEEEHDGAGVVQLVHGVEIRDLRLLRACSFSQLGSSGETDLVNVTKVNGGEVLDAVGYLVEHFILSHAVLIAVSVCVKARQK